MTVAQYIAGFLKKEDITDVFAMTGGYSIQIIEAIRKVKDINIHFMHHQQALVFAAEGYYRLSGRIAPVITSGGPGVMNLMNGIYGCHVDKIPLLLITGNAPLNQMQSVRKQGVRRIGQQDSDIVKIVQSISNSSILLTDQNDIPYKMELAYRGLSPIDDVKDSVSLIDIPLDLQNKQINLSSVKHTHPYTGYRSPQIDLINYKYLLDLLSQASTPVMLIGQRVPKWNFISDMISQIAQKYGMEFVTGTDNSVDAVDNQHSMYLGRVGLFGHARANRILEQQCDLLLIFGSDLTFKTTGYNVKQFAPNAFKVLIDNDYNQVNRHQWQWIDMKIITKPSHILFYLARQKPQYTGLIRNQYKDPFIQHRNSYKHLQQDNQEYVNYSVFLQQLYKESEDRPIVLANGTANVKTLQQYKLKKGQRMFTNIGSASMGWGLPAAIGASLSLNEGNYKDIICIQGDGSLMMNLQQLQTMKHYNLPIKLFVINNQGYNSIKISQDNFCDGNRIGSEAGSGISFPNLEKIADAFQIPYIRINNTKQLNLKLYNCFIHNQVIIQLMVNPEYKHQPRVYATQDQNGNIVPGKLSQMKYSGVNI